MIVTPNLNITDKDNYKKIFSFYCVVLVDVLAYLYIFCKYSRFFCICK